MCFTAKTSAYWAELWSSKNLNSALNDVRRRALPRQTPLIQQKALSMISENHRLRYISEGAFDLLGPSAEY